MQYKKKIVTFLLINKIFTQVKETEFIEIVELCLI